MSDDEHPVVVVWCEPCTRYICDPCERATGAEVEAYEHCAGCGDDLCDLHAQRCDAPLARLLAAGLPATDDTLRKFHSRAVAHGVALMLCAGCRAKVAAVGA